MHDCMLNMIVVEYDFTCVVSSDRTSQTSIEWSSDTKDYHYDGIGGEVVERKRSNVCLLHTLTIPA